MPARSSTPLTIPDTEATGGSSRVRAAAMPAEERRASILAATVPLLIAHGTEITTRQIAAAACVAEGTIFRVFVDKETLIEAAVEQAFDPAPVEAEFRAIDLTLPLEARCEAAVDIVQRRVASLWRILTAVGGPTCPEASATRTRAAPLDPARAGDRVRTRSSAVAHGADGGRRRSARPHHCQQPSGAHGGRSEVAARDRVRDPRRHPHADGRCTRMLMLKLLRTYLLALPQAALRGARVPVRADDGDAAASRRSTPTSSTRASSPATRVTSGGSAACMLGVTLVQVVFAVIAIYFGRAPR